MLQNNILFEFDLTIILFINLLLRIQINCNNNLNQFKKEPFEKEQKFETLNLINLNFYH